MCIQFLLLLLSVIMMMLQMYMTINSQNKRKQWNYSLLISTWLISVSQLSAITLYCVYSLLHTRCRVENHESYDQKEFWEIKLSTNPVK